MKISRTECCGDYISIEVSVKNIGRFAGKEVVQVYCGAEGTTLARPVRELVGFAKTDTLQPGEDAALKIDVRLSDIARYDDIGATGYRSCFVLDAGRYSFFVGTNVRDAAKVLEYEQTQTALVEQLSPVMQPAGGFARLTNNNGLPYI